ncbi:MAG: hypothetical protein IPN79_17815 [Saprospiraceae bacterium]|nr:hypothetical protein [Saprospiraceae bacterium]
MIKLSITKLRELSTLELVSLANDLNRIFRTFGSLPPKIVECLEALFTASIELRSFSQW